jgi:1,2-diacylglycerol 3-alpha-glucosyltransferase
VAREPQAGGFRQIQDVDQAAPLRVGLFTNNYLPLLGGVARAVETLRAALVAAGHRVVVIAPRVAGRPAFDDGPHVVRVPSLPAPTYPGFALPVWVPPATRRAIEGFDLDVYHAQHPFLLGGMARRLARRAGRPLVFTCHTRYDQYAHYVPLPVPLVARAAVRWSTAFANTADRVVAPSEALARLLRGQGVRKPVDVIPTGVDLEVFRPGRREEVRALRERLGLPVDGPLLLYVGRLDREKNLPFLLEGFRRVLASHGGARLTLVGQGTRAAALAAAVAGGPLAGRVHFAGGVPLDRVPPYYQAADLFVFASTTETQGLSVLEALATGLPVVAVRAAGVDEAVRDGVSGLLVPEDAGAFAAAVGQVLADPDLAAKLRHGAREHVRSFAVPALADRMVRAYRRVLAGSRT